MKRLSIVLLSCLFLFTAGCSGAQTDSSVPASAPSLSDSSSSLAESEAPSSSAQDSQAVSAAPSSEASSQAVSKAASSASSKSSVTRPTSSSAASKVPATPPPSSTAAASSESNIVSVTIPEGYTLAKIASKLEANGICSASEMIQAAQTKDFSSHALVKSIPKSSKRAYLLEGYLYPDTYKFYKKSSPEDVLNKMLSNADKRIGSRYQYSGMTTDQVITLASIIEKEADNATDMKLISAVFHNRLKKGMRLESDPTITYCTYVLLPPNGPFADSYKYYYNTYRCAALPAGPICNPGAMALNAAANPADSDYLYFVTSGGKYYYQKTLDEHTAKMKELGMA
jgi:UPF0755 protein